MKYTKLILDERMIVPEPKIRLEFFLHAIVTGEACELKPKTVDEEYLYAIATGDTSRMSEIYPRTLVELYYDAILNNSVEDLPTPRTRWEEFLRSAVTKEPCELEPETSLEIYLSQISSNGGFDYIVSTSTNSTIISLPNSINGTIKSIEMDGNTLVNYCTNGSEELTLNNEINAQGTNVTLTDTVDNSKVDVMCEGNTLVNLLPWKFPFRYWSGSGASYWRHLNYKKLNLVDGKTYSIIIKAKIQDLSYVRLGHANNLSPIQITVQAKDLNKPMPFVATGIENNDFTIIVNKTGNYEWTQAELDSFSAILLEGDWTNKEIPSYFEGMKSVGELEDNKVEILSHKDYITGTLTPYHAQAKPIFYFGYDTIIGSEFELYKKYFNHCGSYANCNNLFDYYSVTDGYWVYLDVWGVTDSDCEKARTIINKHIAEYEGNKNEIQLSEPLRGLPDGVCDKFVKQGGKWYVERNCGEVTLNGSENWNSSYGKLTSDTRPNTKQFYINNFLNNITNGICDNFANKNVYYEDVVGFSLAGGTASIRIGHTSKTTNEFKQWLQQNPTTIVYQLVTPTYEEITDPQVITYLDTTHISTNSTIPCNMKITNSGCNAIIKPSTKYTVALDTDKSGEVNVCLGGAKTSTTNGVATIITPSTLTDDSLTLCGKGIKASNVRLLEGDKTNYIPSFFEGMKSCFEDKEQYNGSYEVEILSNNKNLFRYDSIVKRTSQSEVEYGENYVTITDAYYCGNIVKVKPFTNYYINADITKYDANSNGSIAVYVSDGKKVGSKVMITSINGKGVFNSRNNNYVSILLYGGAGKVGKVKFSNVSLTESTSEAEYIPHKSNSIQLQLNEPLRAVGDVKDRFVLRDGKLMIERNCKEITLNGSEGWSGFVDTTSTDSKNKVVYSNLLLPDMQNPSYLDLACDKLPVTKLYGYHTQMIYSWSNSTIYVHIYKNSLSELNLNGIKQWFRNNPAKLVYPLKVPTYEEVPTSQRLACYENATLFIDTNITPTHVEIEYPTEKQQLFRIK